VCDEPSQAEQDADQVWRSTLSVLAESVAKSGSREIGALSLSVQGDAIIPIGRDKRPMYPAVLGMDYRCALQAQWCEDRLGAKFLFERTGMRPLSLNSLSKIMWLKEKRAEIYRRSWKIVTYADYILDRLRAVGGGARSRLWLQIKADILNRPVSTLAVRERACLGAAILAGAAVGVYRSYG
jgi:xylulokinase